MNHQELDDKVLKQVDGVDWHSVSEADGSRLGLAIGHFRDKINTWKQLQAAWHATFVSVMALNLITIVCMWGDVSPRLTLAVIVVHQASRSVALWWRQRRAKASITESELELDAVTSKLSQQYPSKVTSTDV